MEIIWNSQIQDVELIRNTLNEEEFQGKLLTEIKTWNFVKIENRNDTTIVIYPFTFSR